MAKEYTEAEAIRALSQKGCKISGSSIEVNGGLGLSLLSKVDFLVEHKGYTVKFKKPTIVKTESHD